MIPLLVAVLSTLLVAQYVRHWIAVPDTVARTSDFAAGYVAATLWRDGHGSSIYDERAQRDALAAEGVAAGHDWIPFVNPPGALWLAVPTTALSPENAYRAWSALQLALALAALLVAARAAPWPAAVARSQRLTAVAVAVAAFPVALLFTEGQWDGLSMLGMAIAYALWRRRSALPGGLALGLLGGIAKPHLLLGACAFLAGRRDWRALGGVVAGGALGLLAGLAAVGPDGLLTYIRTVATPANSPATQMLSLTGLMASWLGAGGAVSALTYVGDGLLIAAAAVAGRRSRVHPARLEAALFCAVALGLLATPHLLVHDLTLLAPLAVALCARCAALDGVRWPGSWTAALLASWVALDVTARLDLGNGAAAPPGRLVPLALLGSAVLGWTLIRRRPAFAPAPVAAVPRDPVLTLLA
jgi:hypothetical protein